MCVTNNRDCFKINVLMQPPSFLKYRNSKYDIRVTLMISKALVSSAQKLSPVHEVPSVEIIEMHTS